MSGNDVGSDENDVDDDDQLDFYEAEEGDNDEVPDDETIREQLHKQWLKQQQVRFSVAFILRSNLCLEILWVFFQFK